MKKQLLTLFICLALPLTVLAGAGFYVTVENHTKYQTTITPDGNHNWYCNDFCGPKEIPSQATKRFYTEAKGIFPLQFATGIQGINITYGSTIAHVEFWIDHEHSVSKHIKTAGVRVGEIIKQFGVGTSSDQVDTSFSATSEGDFGTANATLYLN